MLNPDALAEYISNSIRTIVCPAIKQCLLNSYPMKSDAADQIAENFSINFDEMVSDELGKALADAITYYIKTIAITGTIITVGSPTTQTATITSSPTPMVNGVVPNTLGIS